MSIYTPYFYIIQDNRNGMYYAGSKYGKDANPNKFMVEGGYTTSSETINRIIHENGLSIFAIRKVITFETGSEAYNHEKRFLEKVNARDNPRFYNKHNNKLYAFGTSEYKELMNDLIGAENPSSLDWVKEKVKNSLQTNNNGYTLESDSKSRSKFEETMMKRYGVIHPMNADSIKKKHKQNFLDKHGVENPSQLSETKQKVKITVFENYGGYTLEKDSISRTKFEETMLERYGVDNALKSPEIREKIKNTNVEKYGVENPSQSEEIKAKKKETMMKNYGGIHPNKGRIVITDGKESKFCRPGEIPEGWWKGRPK